MSCDFKGRRVFLSGPMTGKKDWNRQAFADSSAWCMEQGTIEVFDPADGAPNGSDPHTHEHWMRMTLHELTRWVNGTRNDDNRPYYDALALLPGWEGSEGARVEKMVAEACGIEVVKLGDAL